MKKFSKVLTALCLAVFSIALVACSPELEMQDGGTKVHHATITNWYEYEGEKYLDTSININFDEITITDIDKVTFEIYNGLTLIGNAVSEGENLTNLLKDAASYWEQTAETYTNVTGDRILSCAFKTRNEMEDNGLWVLSKCTATEGEIPDKLVVKVVVGNIEYVADNVEDMAK